MDVFNFSVLSLNSASFLYLAACFFFIFAVAAVGGKNEKLWRGLGSWAVLLAFAAHTAGLLMRWYLGGISRPPWTNLYESLIFFAWGLSLFLVWILHKWKISLLGLIACPLIFCLMGMSVMTSNKEVEPLIPALQSNWLKIHVVFGMLSYAGFSIAGCLAFLQLMRNGVSLSKIGAGLAFMSLLNLGIAAGDDFFVGGKIVMAKTVTRTLENGKEVQARDQYREYDKGPIMTRVEEVPVANYFVGLSFLSFLGAMGVMYRRGQRESKNRGRVPLSPSALDAAMHGKDWNKAGVILFSLGTLGIVGFFGAVTAAVYHSPTLSLHSNSYLMVLMFMTLLFCAIYLLLGSRYRAFLQSLPTAQRLDELSYKNILFAFPFQTLLLVTGAIWAYYAWGRSWGWDPKETWAFITWMAYLIYLHGKLLMRWKPNFLSVVAIGGFLILVFAFLGVNLVLSGLHSYGSA